MGLRDTILQAADLPVEKVHVPEWGVDVWVRGLTAKERDVFEASTFETAGKNRKINLQNFRARLLVLCLVDENGVKLFTAEDIEALSAKSAAALDPLFLVANRLSGMTDKDVDTLTKN